jgi:membrane associated rhomboid family serine protease
MGRGHFAVFFLMSGIIATLAHVAVQLDSTVPVVGASGAVAGVMGVYLVWFPRARVRTLVFITIIPLWPRLPAAVLLVVWFVSQFYIGNNSGVAWMAHVAGFIFGVVAGLVGKNERLRT